MIPQYQRANIKDFRDAKSINKECKIALVREGYEDLVVYESYSAIMKSAASADISE